MEGMLAGIPGLYADVHNRSTRMYNAIQKLLTGTAHFCAPGLS